MKSAARLNYATLVTFGQPHVADHNGGPLMKREVPICSQRFDTRREALLRRRLF
jgi:hypothetical protein